MTNDSEDNKPANTPSANNVILVSTGGPGCLIRAIYFIFIGWWLAGLWIIVAWLLNVTVIGLPIGLVMLNRVPQIMTLSPGSQKVEVSTLGGITTIAHGTEQFPMAIRVVYFILVGWWLSLLWTIVAYLLTALVITWPIAYAMFNVIGFVTTLRKN